jgi:hypothetical protein
MHCLSQDTQIRNSISQSHQQIEAKNEGTKLDNVYGRDAKGLFRQPTAEEVARLTFGELSTLRVHAQDEARNYFAHLLNRGSSLE